MQALHRTESMVTVVTSIHTIFQTLLGDLYFETSIHSFRPLYKRRQEEHGENPKHLPQVQVVCAGHLHLKPEDENVV